MLPYKYFMLFESILKVDPQFLLIIKNLQKEGDIIASALSNLIDNDIKTNINYIKPGKANDEIVFVNDTQVKRITDAGENPFEKTGNIAKVGRAIRQILGSNTIPIVDKDIETFVNRYKNAWNNLFNNTQEKIRLVKGEDIRYWYLEDKYTPGGGPLNNSCMRYAKTQTYLDIYVANPERVNLLIYLNDEQKITGRSLVWFYEEDGVKKAYQDRIYTSNDSDVLTMLNWFKERFKENGLNYTEGDYRKKIKVKLDKFQFKEYPYMDSLYYLDFKEGIIKSFKDSKEKAYTLRFTNGGFNVEGHYWSHYQNDWVYEREAVYIEQQENGEDIGYVNRNICVPDYNGTYILNDRVVKSELYGPIDKSVAIETEKWGIIPKNCLIEVIIGIDDKGTFTKDKMPDKLMDSEFVSAIYTSSGSSIRVINELAFKTLNNKKYVKPESKWTSPNIDIRVQLIELFKVKSDDCTVKRVERYSIKYPFTYIKNGFPVGCNLHENANSTLLDHFYTTQKYIDMYNLEKMSEDIEYLPKGEFYYNLYVNDTITDEVISSFGDDTEELKKAEAFLCSYVSGYLQKRNKIQFTKTYNYETTLNNFNKALSEKLLPFIEKIKVALNFDMSLNTNNLSSSQIRSRCLKIELIERISKCRRGYQDISDTEAVNFIKENMESIEWFLYNLFILQIDARQTLARYMFSNTGTSPDDRLSNIYEITYNGDSRFGDELYSSANNFIYYYSDRLSNEQRIHFDLFLKEIKPGNIKDFLERSKIIFGNFKEAYLNTTT